MDFYLLWSKGGEEIEILLNLLGIQGRHRHLAIIIAQLSSPLVSVTGPVWVLLNGLDDVQESLRSDVVRADKFAVDVWQQL